MTEISKEWCINMAKQEEGDIGAGKLAIDPTSDKFHKLALNESFERVAKVAEERQAFNEAMALREANIERTHNMTDKQIKHMVERFLMWKLPEPWHPDAGISFKPSYDDEPMRSRHWPIGTNLFDYTQAEAMVRHMLEGVEDACEPLTDAEQSIINEAWEKHKSAKPVASMDNTNAVLADRHEIQIREDLSGYYISFERTGNEHIDRLIGAIAFAGKMYHHTEDWDEEMPHFGKGFTCLTNIQNAANSAADALRQPTQSDADLLDAEGVKLYWYRQGKDDGVEQERAKIVAWLRKEAIMSTDTVRRRMNKALDQIEAGEHLQEQSK